MLLFLPAFNQLAGKKLGIQFLDPKIMLTLLVIAIGTGLISGSYPALFLSSFRPSKVLKGKSASKGGNLFFRNGLVVTQFIVSIILLAGTVVVYQQLKFIRDRNMGFDKENLLYMPMAGEMWNKGSCPKNRAGGKSIDKEFYDYQ